MRLLLFGLALVVTHVSAHGFVSKCEAYVQYMTAEIVAQGS